MNKKKIKVFITHSNASSYINWIDNAEECKSIDDADLVLLPGGADVNPSLYGEKESRLTFINPELDFKDITFFEKAIKNNIPILGICRGHQLLGVLAGGKLIQDMPGHNGMTHKIEFKDGSNGVMSTAHHQAVAIDSLPEEDGQLIAWHNKVSTLPYKDEDTSCVGAPKGTVEVEIMYYPKFNALGIQGHPEYASVSKEMIEKCNNLLKDYIFDETNKKRKLQA